jgi:hypothetical protein
MFWTMKKSVDFWEGARNFFWPVDCIDFDLALDCVTKLVMKWGVIVARRNVWYFKMHDLIT